MIFLKIFYSEIMRSLPVNPVDRRKNLCETRITAESN